MRRLVPLIVALAAIAGGLAAGSASPEAVASSILVDSPTASPGAHAAYKLFPWRWPGARIPYFNAARRNAWAVRSAVRAWNASGMRARFVAVPRSRAKLVIRYFGHGCVSGGSAPIHFDQGTLMPEQASVLMSRPHPRHAACSRWTLTRVAAHELGHVLGLNHEDHRCALMNSRLENLVPGWPDLVPAHCPAQLDWRCRILEADDVRGAVRLYGGRVKPRLARIC
jgi:hypothetical protein